MQVFIAKTLNRLLVLFSLVTALLFAGIFASSRFFPAYMRWHILVFITVSAGLAVLYRWLEENWDKRIIMKMAGAGKAALMNIREGRRIMAVRDTFFRNYWICEISGTLYDHEHRGLEKTFREKMSRTMGEIPSGSVYVTWDEEKPAQIFIIPNALVGSLPDLKPLVDAYEGDRTIQIKYLDAHYNRGMVLRSFGEALREYREKETEKKTEKEKDGVRS